MLKEMFREPIPEIQEAARFLDAAVSAHMNERYDLADELIRMSDIPQIRDWTESIWGAKSPYVRIKEIADAPPTIPKDQRSQDRLPNTQETAILVNRDGYHCRICGIPLIRKAIRVELKKRYPNAVSWGRKNVEQHAALQAMWLQYDHVLPHSRGGGNELSNIIITCAPCNFARMEYLFEEVSLLDPSQKEPVRSTWDGLERLLLG